MIQLAHPSQSDAANRRIIFVTPPYERIAPGYEYVKEMTNKAPSLGLLHLAAEVREHGYEPSIIESDIFDLSAQDVVERILEERPAYVGITLFTVGVWTAAEIARKVKAVAPEITILVGGPHISSMGAETMERFPEFDVAVIGEGEEILTMLLEYFDGDRALADVPGIIYIKDGAAQKHPGMKVNRDMDRLPMPAWDLLPNFPKAYRPAAYDYPREPVATVAASRGCPFHCKFCDTSTFGASVRAFSAQRVFDIMQHLQATYGVKHIFFVDDLFTASRRRTLELCNLIIDSGMDMTWSCASRVDVVKQDLLHLMKKAGCWEISFGLETGSNELLKKMDKAARVERSEEALNWTHEAGIRSKGLFMLGFPGETEATIADTKAFVRRVPLTIMHLTKFTPYPGSPIYKDIYGTKIRDDHWEKMNGMNFLWTPEGITHEELDKHYRQILLSFYKRHRIAAYYTRFSFTYPRHFVRLMRFFHMMMFSKLKRALGIQSSRKIVELDGDASQPEHAGTA